MRKTNRNSKKKRSNKIRTKVVIPTGEMKICDTFATTPVSTVASINSLCAVQQGIQVNQRIGRKIYVKSIEFKAVITAGTALVGSTVATVRVVILSDKQQIQSTAPAITDYMFTPSVTEPRNLYFMNRFHVLKDQIYKVDVYNPTVNIVKRMLFSTTLEYGGAGLGDITKNGIYIILVSNNAGNAPNISYSMRVWFNDS